MFLVFVLLIATLLSIYVLIEPEWLSVPAIFLSVGLFVLYAFFIVIFVGFKDSIGMTHRLRSLSLIITRYAQGEYGVRAYDYSGDEDELSRIFSEMNELGEKMDNQVQSLERLADENAELAKMTHNSAVIEERQRLARDLHDSVSQQLFALSMMAEAAVKQMDTKPELAKGQIADVAAAAHHAQAEMRALLLHLRPVYLAGESLIEGIGKLTEEIAGRNEIGFQLDLPVDEVALSDAVEEHVFRIVQEALSNILRHSEATHIKLRVTNDEERLFIHIADNGKGFLLDEQIEKKTSLGLQTMKERAEEVGGSFSIRSQINEGTYIDIRVPLKGVS